MNLVDEYRRQAEWRSWPAILAALPPLEGRTVLDLGCAVGDQAALLAALGARVIGFDLNEVFLEAARARGIAGATFRGGDLRELPDPGVVADGLWGGFVAAYFVDLAPTIAAWERHLRPDAWIALTEIDDMFGHEPLGEHARALFEGYAREALAARRYDFHMGRRLGDHLAHAGYAVEASFAVEDRELAFDGPARPDVLDAWRLRFERMPMLRDFCGGEFERVRDEFLACLARPDHRSRARVLFCLGRRGAS
jgi:SAM-dependent methyltransferase